METSEHLKDLEKLDEVLCNASGKVQTFDPFVIFIDNLVTDLGCVTWGEVENAYGRTMAQFQSLVPNHTTFLMSNGWLVKYLEYVAKNFQSLRDVVRATESRRELDGFVQHGVNNLAARIKETYPHKVAEKINIAKLTRVVQELIHEAEKEADKA